VGVLWLGGGAFLSTNCACVPKGQVAAKTWVIPNSRPVTVPLSVAMHTRPERVDLSLSPPSATSTTDPSPRKRKRQLWTWLTISVVLVSVVVLVVVVIVVMIKYVFVAVDVVITAAALCALLEVLLGTAPELLPPMTYGLTYGSRKE